MIEYEPWDGESGGTIRILVRGSIAKLLFGDLDSKEIAAIAAEIFPVWKAAIASKSRIDGAEVPLVLPAQIESDAALLKPDTTEHL